MRGKRPCILLKNGAQRNIPAYAGKTLVLLLDIGVFQEHPRVCGENHRSRFGGASRRGTSPRMRGKRTPSKNHTWEIGNIPAYAGKTQPRSTSESSAWEHPRVCGENLKKFCELAPQAGTSPRMRGKRTNIQVCLVHFGNIPAYAGKTCSAGCSGNAAEEHPRVCGENNPGNP